MPESPAEWLPPTVTREACCTCGAKPEGPAEEAGPAYPVSAATEKQPRAGCPLCSSPPVEQVPRGFSTSKPSEAGSWGSSAGSQAAAGLWCAWSPRPGPLLTCEERAVGINLAWPHWSGRLQALPGRGQCAEPPPVGRRERLQPCKRIRRSPRGGRLEAQGSGLPCWPPLPLSPVGWQQIETDTGHHDHKHPLPLSRPGHPGKPRPSYSVYVWRTPQPEELKYRLGERAP